MQNRYSYLDSDEYRLPEGMRRVGYDSDTQQYTFRDSQGYYTGEPGNEYGGRLTYTSPLRGNERDDDTEFTPPSFSAPNSPYRPLLPFFVIVGVVLLLLIKLLYSGSTPQCPHGEYTIAKGDTCWDIAQAHDVPLHKLEQTLPCNALIPGTRICLPKKSAHM